MNQKATEVSKEGWQLLFLTEASHDFARLSSRQRIVAARAIDKVWRNFLPAGDEGPELSELQTIHLKSAGLCIVYRLVHIRRMMLVIVIADRTYDQVYETVEKRIRRFSPEE